jgi:hypothetical protein
MTRSNSPEPSELLGVVRGGGVHVGRLVAGRDRSHPGGADGVEQVDPRLLLVPVVAVVGHEALVAEPEGDPVPVDVVRRGEVRDPAVDQPGDRPPSQGDVRSPSTSLGVTDPLQEPYGDRLGHARRIGADDDVTHHQACCSFSIRAAVAR